MTVTHNQSRNNQFSYDASLWHTPADDGVPVEVASLGEEGFHQQCEEIETFDEEPEVVWHHTVMEEDHHCLTPHLNTEKHIQVRIQTSGYLLAIHLT